MKRPVMFAVPIILIMIAMIIPLGQLSLGGISEKYLPPNNSVRLAQEEFDKIYPGFRTEPLTLVIQNNDGQPVTDQQIAEIRSRAMGISGFTDPDNNPDAMWNERPYLDGASKDPSVRVIQNGLVTRSDAAKKIGELREITPPKGLSLYVGGTPALEQDSIHSLFSKLPLMVLLLITTTTILMFLAFGSLVLPIKAALMSALTLGSTMGVLTWMFVDGHGSGLMNYTPQPLMAPMIGLIIAVIYGLSTDYEVFLVSRMVEAREQGMSTTEAIRIGTATTGRLITAAALVLAVVAGAFVFSDLVMMKYLAFGLLIALLLDATVVRMFLVPAIMKLLGDDCWWAPMWMKRLQHKIGMGETTLPDERKRAVLPEPEKALVGATVSSPRQRVAAGGSTALATEPVSAPVEEAPTTRFASTPAREERDIGSWLGELRRKASVKRPTGAERGPDPSVEPTNVLPSGEPTNVISAPDDATTAIPALSADETRAIPVSRPQAADSDVATEQLNARGQHGGGGVSAADLLRREGRL
jgi:RND superfamily putative drug exporter